VSPRRHWQAKSDPGPVPWWEWREGWRPAGWSDRDEAIWSGEETTVARRPLSQERVIDEADRLYSRRLWAALLLALDLDTCRSILSGRAVRAGNLDGVVLRRALRGARLPDPESYFVVSHEMLDAVAEAGPLEMEDDKQ
jgi:hypothetical protein